MISVVFRGPGEGCPSGFNKWGREFTSYTTLTHKPERLYECHSMTEVRSGCVSGLFEYARIHEESGNSPQTKGTPRISRPWILISVARSAELQRTFVVKCQHKDAEPRRGTSRRSACEEQDLKNTLFVKPPFHKRTPFRSRPPSLSTTVSNAAFSSVSRN